MVIATTQSPGLDAGSLARRLRASPRWNHTTLVALVDGGDDEETAAARQAGFDHVLPKSNWELLVDELRALLGLSVEVRPNGEDHGGHADHPPVASPPKTRVTVRRKSAARRANGRGLALVEGA
jgi:DNA-binding response OmpR family regulator